MLTFLLFSTREELVPHLRQAEDGLSDYGILSETPELKLSFSKKDDDSNPEAAKQKQTFMKKNTERNTTKTVKNFLESL